MKALLFNDTSYEQHHGSQLVVQQIFRLAAEAGIRIERACPMRYDWAADEQLKSDIRAADLCLINGEGTMHDDARQALRLGALAEYCYAHNVPCFLINSVWQRNVELNRLAKFFTNIYVRDAYSAAELQRSAIQVTVVPDLTLTLEDLPAVAHARRGGLVNGNVYAERTLEAWSTAHTSTIPSIGYLSIKALPLVQVGKGFSQYVWKSLARRLKGELHYIFSRFGSLPADVDVSHVGQLRWRFSARSLPAFLTRIGNAEWVVSGRFHCITLCLLMRTPFFAVSSNTHKIEALIKEVGLSARVKNTYQQALGDIAQVPFSPDELRAIESFLVGVRLRAKDMFAGIADTVRSRQVGNV